MGLITADTAAVSGVLPQAEAFAVHYPGYPSSTARALETLGGVSEIDQARSSQPSPLELRFRPEDPYSHPALGHLRSCAGLLLRISRKKSGGGDGATAPSGSESGGSDGASAPSGSESGGDGAGQLFADVVARVPQAYKFDGMIDYQHVIPVHAAQRKKRNWNELEPNFEKSGLMDLDEEDLLILVPPFFTLKEFPQDLVLKPTELSQAKRKLLDAAKEKWETEIEPCLALDFGITVIPEKIKWEYFVRQGTSEWEQQVAMIKLFEEKPIWPRASLKERLRRSGLDVKADCFKRLLLRSAYYFSRGPFRGFWIRKGYDPRQDSESRIYQRVDFRVPSQTWKTNEAASFDGLEPSWNNLCEFRAFPTKKFSTLQLFELTDDFIQEEIRKPVQQTVCTIHTGWFSKAIFDTLMLRVKMRFMALCKNLGSEDIVKLISERFEKSKLSQVLEKNLRPDKVDECLHATKGDGETNSAINCHDDKWEHNELDDENYIDEFGGDEPNQMDGENEEFYSQEDANIPSKYMHKILKSLPFYGKGLNFSDNSDDAIDVDGAENDYSGSEYSILEPSSDGENIEDDENVEDDDDEGADDD